MSQQSELVLTSALKFNGSNFTLWKMKMLAYLQDKDLLEVVESPIRQDDKVSKIGSDLGDQKAELTADEEKLKKKAMKAYTILVLALQDEQLQLIVDVPRGNAYGVWKALLLRYERKTVASKTQARIMLSQCKMAKDETVDGYISRIKRIVMTLVDMGSQISNDELLHVLFNGLPEAYGPLIDTISVNTKLEFEEACTFIRDRQERVKVKMQGRSEEDGNEVEEANYAKDEDG
jgi:hypothetical protein